MENINFTKYPDLLLNRGVVESKFRVREREGMAKEEFEEKVEHFRKGVIEFYLTRGASWPWRKARDPYVVLVTELLLQKTTARQVMEVFESFFSKFPTVEALAKADEKEIEEIIGKLGLRKRARFLREIARYVVENFGGKIPEARESLMELKGVGVYTANAVLSFAYGKCVPVVDRNVARVLRRFFGFKEDIPAYMDTQLLEFAGKVMPTSMCREFNYGLIDLGAKVCVPVSPRLGKSPHCDECPLRDSCTYFLERHPNKLLLQKGFKERKA
jgi:A/G-specific adenine glycosylase